MPDMMKVKPRLDATTKTPLVVRNPSRAMRPIASAGEFVPLTTYWRRRLAAGDVVEVTSAAEPHGGSKVEAAPAAQPAR